MKCLLPLEASLQKHEKALAAAGTKEKQLVLVKDAEILAVPVPIAEVPAQVAAKKAEKAAAKAEKDAEKAEKAAAKAKAKPKSAGSKWGTLLTTGVGRKPSTRSAKTKE